MRYRVSTLLFLTLICSVTAVTSTPLSKSQKDAIKKFWTKDRISKAIPRDFVIDSRGLAYIKGKNDRLIPHGHAIAAERKDVITNKKSGGGSDTQKPTISEMNPASGSVIGSSKTFSANVFDASGIKSLSFIINYPNGQSQSFNPSNVAGTDTWVKDLSGFTDGNWSWEVVAKDNGARGGNTATKGPISFIVDSSGSGTVDNEYPVINNQQWSGGDVQTAAGRLYFYMGGYYICSGTVVTDNVTGRSIVLTAAHCVYDDVNKKFASYAMFIPNQAATSGTNSDLNCDNDPLGCWVMDYGVVDVDWTSRTFPDNIPYDYGFYVVNDSTTENILDQTTADLPLVFTQPGTDSIPESYTHALGYSGSDDPNFMYCAESLTKKTSSSGRGRNRTIIENWWLSQCGLSGGSSGGPWVQPMNESSGSGPIVSVNSWKYSNDPLGMAGPRLDNSSAGCLFATITNDNFAPVLDDPNGHVENGCN